MNLSNCWSYTDTILQGFCKSLSIQVKYMIPGTKLAFLEISYSFHEKKDCCCWKPSTYCTHTLCLLTGSHFIFNTDNPTECTFFFFFCWKELVFILWAVTADASLTKPRLSVLSLVWKEHLRVPPLSCWANGSVSAAGLTEAICSTARRTAASSHNLIATLSAKRALYLLQAALYLFTLWM